MKKKFLILIILLFSIQTFFGQTDQKIDITFDNITFREAIIELEKITEFKFFFEEEWIMDIKVNGTSNNATIKTILNDILKETSINFFIKDNRIILLKNNIIHSQLPIRYFEKESIDEEITNSGTPIFQEQFVPKSGQENNLVTIGKQNSNIKSSTFTLSGQIFNDNTNEPVQNLSISTTDGKIYAVTDAKGYYKIELPYGMNRLETNLLGFDKNYQDVIIYGAGSLNLKITENIESLDEVNINSKMDANVKNAAIGVSIINIQKVKTMPLVLGERDLLKVATTLPGIKSAGEGSSGINVRGGRADQNLFLLDDAVIYNPSHFLGLFSAINPFSTGSLDIYKASIPAQYGGRLSSVFDIKTKPANTEKISGEGSIGPITANLALELPIVKEKSSLLTGFRITNANYILKTLEDESLKNSEASFYDAIAKYSHKINDNNTIQGTFYYSNDQLRITSDSIFGYNNSLISLKWNHIISEKSRADVIASTSKYNYDVNYEAESNGNFDFGYTIREDQFKLNLNTNLNLNHKLNYGVSSKMYTSDPGNIEPVGIDSDIDSKTIQREKGLESAIYLADNYKVSDRILFDLGLRYSHYASLGEGTQTVYSDGEIKNESTIQEVRTYDKNEVIQTYGGFEYRVSGRYLFDNDFSIKAAVNRTIQYIHLLTTNTTISPTDIWKLSDLNIKPQFADQFSLGFFKNLDDNNIEISLEGYYKKMNDLLDYKIGAQLILNDNLETELLQGEGKAYGIELLVKKNLGRLNGYFGYSYSRALIKLNGTIEQEKVNNGDYFPANYDKPHDFTIIGNYKLTKRLSFSSNFTYQTGRPVTYPVGKFVFANEERVLYSDRNQYRIPDYYRLDIGFNIEGNHKLKKLGHSFVNISVYNVLGRNNPYSIFFVNEKGNVSNRKGKISAYKTSIFSVPVPTITYNFKF